MKQSKLRAALMVAAISAAAATSAVEAAETGTTLSMTGVVYTADEHGNSVSAIDLASGRVNIVPVSISPHNVQITADGERLLATGTSAGKGHGHGAAASEHGSREGKGRLLVFDAAEMRSGPLASIEVGSHPAHVVVDRAGRRALSALPATTPWRWSILRAGRWYGTSSRAAIRMACDSVRTTASSMSPTSRMAASR
jgi:DNA-binding beta-propeller fold protein YncE